MEVVAFSRLGSMTQEEKIYVPVFIETVLSITRVQALHINNPAFLSQ